MIMNFRGRLKEGDLLGKLKVGFCEQGGETSVTKIVRESQSLSFSRITSNGVS